MRWSGKWFYLCLIFTFGGLLSFNGGGYATVHAMIIACETPNNDTGICLEIRMCPVLFNQLMNKESWPFLRASQCGQEGETTPKVCCGKYGNFRNVNKNIAEDDVLPKHCGRQEDLLLHDRIIGGRRASIGEYPWMALLLYRNKYGQNVLGCSGFLIHTKYVVTAAHCTHANVIKQKGPIVSVLLGEHDIKTRTDCSGTVCVKNIQNIRIDKMSTHPEYNPTDISQYNDIAIIQLKENALLTDYVQPICLVDDDNETPVSYFLSGWGRTENNSYSKVKLFVQISAFNKTKCVEKYSSSNIKLKDTQICAGGEDQKDSCSGDSGGPLMISSDDQTWYAAGIVSFGMGCGMKGWPGVYTNIAKFLPWLKSEMAQ
ncbi:serine protease 7-like isoform X1 [Anoplophora glabripennis]|uniref:serine protease 7-like isoform X1 n=1 Tax=Anoplophora glabripennis TaxID=217634 RepID=UPI000875485B|nr:serine protease 7-like isoform X1 [Anoplophora glabripennis]